MNTTEANAFFTLLRGLETRATDDQRDAAVIAAEQLTRRANACLGAGPVAPQVAVLVRDVIDAVQVAADEAEYAVEVRLGDRPVETVTTGAVL